MEVKEMRGKPIYDRLKPAFIIPRLSMSIAESSDRAGAEVFSG